ncbi:YY1-associated factor 2-like [Tubulanus polymorphus]|uniref:YY1-associated factor 2-like n=1 Tax=Tubulanus polymorphus TaxID=672921 RepID=UPI003DA2AAF5
MEEKRGSSRTKRNKKHDEGKWDCSVCTFQNPVEAFKCEMCDVRKGTSTRKPRLNPHLVAQVAQQYAPPPPPKKEKLSKKERKELSNSASGSSSHSSRLRSPRLKNIDRTSAQHMAVTVNNVTVIITDYKPKIQNSNSSSTNSVNTSNTSDREDDDESLDESEDAASDAETDKDES